MLATLQAAPADVRRPFDAGERPPASPIDAVQTQRLALWALSALDRLDQGIVLLTPDARVCFANRRFALHKSPSSRRNFMPFTIHHA